MLIGICGKSGSGKTTIAKRLMNLHKNAIHIEIDKIGHEVLLYEEVKKELINAYGESIICNNSIDRKKLGDIVFSSRKEMDKLTEITWKNMQIIIDKIINENKDKIIILDWLLLPKTKYFNMCKFKILLDIPYEIRKQRAILRDNISEEEFKLREKSSIEYDNNDFDYVIDDSLQINNERLVLLR